MAFSDLDLAPEILRAVGEQGYTQPTPIQARAIPLVLEGRDLMAGAQTGTGKTAAFTLPLLQKLLPHANASASPARHPVRALILTPTRELAIQVEESVKTYGKHLPLRSLVVYGGVDIKTQTPQLMRGVEILVATPGRLLDHVEQRTVQLNQVQILVLDEADRMLDMGFLPDLKRILDLLPRQRQSLMFSATFSSDIKRLAEDFLTRPTLVEVARSNAAAENVEQRIYRVSLDDKQAVLAEVLRRENAQALVFTRTKLATARLARMLVRDGIAADAIHGDKSQKERLEALEAFKQGKVTTLVATDVAARGLDIDQLPLVINYEIPHTPEDYVHRIGRTGRAGASGVAISLVAPEEEKYLKEIEKLIKRELKAEEAPRPQREERRPWREREPARERESAMDQPRGGAHARSHAPAKDPWFSRPYEPDGSNPAQPRSLPTPPHKKQREIPALLGGLLRRPE